MKTSTYKKIRLAVLTFSTMLFPVTFYYLSPVISMQGSYFGVVSGSLIVFIVLLILSIFLGRSFCSWLCPAGGIQDQIAQSRTKRVNVKKISWIKYLIWGSWLGGLLFLFKKSGGVNSIQIAYATEHGFSTTSLPALIAYSSVIIVFILLSLIFGKRTGCHTICWISPFMIIGKKLSEFLKIPSFHLKTEKNLCVHCGKCNISCPMSLNVEKLLESDAIIDNNCILCGECKEVCPKNLFSWKFGAVNKK